MRVPNPSPVLDKNPAPIGPEILSSTGAGVWRKAPKAFPDSSSVLYKFQSATFCSSVERSSYAVRVHLYLCIQALALGPCEPLGSQSQINIDQACSSDKNLLNRFVVKREGNLHGRLERWGSCLCTMRPEMITQITRK